MFSLWSDFMKRSKGTLSSRTKRMRADEPLTVARMVKSFEVGAKVVINVTSYIKKVFQGLDTMEDMAM